MKARGFRDVLLGVMRTRTGVREFRNVAWGVMRMRKTARGSHSEVYEGRVVRGRIRVPVSVVAHRVGGKSEHCSRGRYHTRSHEHSEVERTHPDIPVREDTQVQESDTYPYQLASAEQDEHIDRLHADHKGRLLASSSDTQVQGTGTYLGLLVSVVQVVEHYSSHRHVLPHDVACLLQRAIHATEGRPPCHRNHRMRLAFGACCGSAS